MLKYQSVHQKKIALENFLTNVKVSNYIPNQSIYTKASKKK